MGRANLKRGGLSQPQWELLCEIVDGKRDSCAENYPPRYTLGKLGFVQFVTRRYGQDQIIATPSGRKLVEDVRSAEETDA